MGAINAPILDVAMCLVTLIAQSQKLDEYRLGQGFAVVKARMPAIVCTVSTLQVAASTFAASERLPLWDETCLIPAYR